MVPKTLVSNVCCIRASSRSMTGPGNTVRPYAAMSRYRFPTCARNSGIVDQHVDASFLLDDLLNPSLDTSVVSDVHAQTLDIWMCQCGHGLEFPRRRVDFTAFRRELLAPMSSGRVSEKLANASLRIHSQRKADATFRAPSDDDYLLARHSSGVGLLYELRMSGRQRRLQ